MELLLIFLGVILLVLLIIKLFFHRENKKMQKNLMKFKGNAVKIKVNLEDIKIISNSWTEEREKYTSDRDAGIVIYNKLTHNDHKNVDLVQVNLNHLIYAFTYQGNAYIYEELIDYDTEKLRIWFIFKKETDLYLDINTEEMYLDLEFLE